ncbi:Tn3 family transposase [Kitasatospora sp. NPDC058190]|uniref:Tn3 family transposase n=1 Tax=Kitasatospora sp. NPDC058190 TaxID=3346371 RepID=UPI0036DACBB6
MRLRRPRWSRRRGDPVGQEEAVEFDALLTSCPIFHNTLDFAQAMGELQAEGWKVEIEDLAEVAPCLTEKIMRSAGGGGRRDTKSRATFPQAGGAKSGCGSRRGPDSRAREVPRPS